MTPFQFVESPPAQAGVRVIEVPAGLESRTALFDFLAKEIPLPAYFGHNWDALEECLSGLDWLAGGAISLVHHDLPLKTHAEQKVYLQVLAAAVKTSDRLHVAFPPQDRAGVEQLLSPA